MRLQSLGEIFPAAVLRRDDFFSSQFFPNAAVYLENFIAPFLVERRAAHAFLHVVSAAISVFDDGLHDVVEFRDQHVAGRDKNFSLIDFRARLVEALFDVTQIEHDIIGGGLADDPNDLAFLDFKSFAAVALDDRFADEFSSFPPEMNLILRHVS